DNATVCVLGPFPNIGRLNVDNSCWAVQSFERVLCATQKTPHHMRSNAIIACATVQPATLVVSRKMCDKPNTKAHSPKPYENKSNETHGLGNLCQPMRRLAGQSRRPRRL